MSRTRTDKARISPALRWEVWARDNFTCAYCGTRTHLAADHKIPESRGGPTDAENLVTVCGRCNSRKGAMTHEEFVARRETALVTRIDMQSGRDLRVRVPLSTLVDFDFVFLIGQLLRKPTPKNRVEAARLYAYSNSKHPIVCDFFGDEFKTS